MKPTDGRGLNNLLAQRLNNIPCGQRSRGVIARFNVDQPPFVNLMLERRSGLFRRVSVTLFRNEFLSLHSQIQFLFGERGRASYSSAPSRTQRTRQSVTLAVLARFLARYRWQSVPKLRKIWTFNVDWSSSFHAVKDLPDHTCLRSSIG